MFFIFLGVLYFIDWSDQKKGKQRNIRLLKFLDEPMEPREAMTYNSAVRRIANRLLYFLALVIVSFLSGWLVAMFISFWPQDYYLYLLFTFLVEGRNYVGAASAFSQYALGLTLPMILLWIIYMITQIRSVSNNLNRTRSLIRIIFSAAFIASGIGLLRFSL